MTRTDRDHLRVLAICHYILAGLCFVAGLFPVIHLVIGIVIVTEGVGGQKPPPKGPPPEFIGWMFIGIASAVIVSSWALAAGLVAAGRCLTRRTSRTFCLVVAGFACLFQPLGLILGVFTFVVLMRSSVRDAFDPPRDEPPEHDRYYSE